MKVVVHSCRPETKKDRGPRRVERDMTPTEEAAFVADQAKLAEQRAAGELAEKKRAAMDALTERVLQQALADPDAPPAVKDYASALGKGG